MLILFILVSSISFIILSQANLTEDHILNPIGLSTKIFASDGLGINMPIMIFFILLFPLAFSVLCLYSLTTKDLDYTILIAPLIVAPLFFFFLGISITALLISVGFIISAFLAYYMSFQDKKHYKKISIYGVTAHGTAKALLLMNIFIGLSVYLLLISTPHSVEDRLNSDLSGAMDDVLPVMIEVSALDSQRMMIYDFLESIEFALISSMEAGISEDLTVEESAKCAAALKKNQAIIDEQAKAQIDAEFEKQMADLGSSSLLPEPMIRKFSPYYPLFIVFSLFVTLEFLRIFFFVPLAGIYAFLLKGLLGMPKEKKMRKTIPDAHQTTMSPVQTHAGRNPYYSQSTQQFTNPYYDAAVYPTEKSNGTY